MEIVDFVAIEKSKENIEPRREGYSVNLLKMAMETSKPEFESQKNFRFSQLKELEASGLDMEEDPLDLCIDYLVFLKSHIAFQHCNFADWKEALEFVSKLFVNDFRYKNDPRYVRIWCLYAYCCRDPLEVFRYLSCCDIGQFNASYYESYAEYLGYKLGHFEEAMKIFQLGISKNAQPLKRLKQSMMIFQQKYMKEKLNELDGSVSLVKKPLGPPLKIKKDAFPQKKISIFRDEDQESVFGPFGSLLNTSDDERHKENIQLAVPWMGVKYPQQTVSSATYPKIAVHKDKNIYYSVEEIRALVYESQPTKTREESKPETLTTTSKNIQVYSDEMSKSVDSKEAPTSEPQSTASIPLNYAPSPTINTKNALKEIMEMFNDPLPVNDTYEEINPSKKLKNEQGRIQIFKDPEPVELPHKSSVSKELSSNIKTEFHTSPVSQSPKRIAVFKDDEVKLSSSSIQSQMEANFAKVFSNSPMNPFSVGSDSRNVKLNLNHLKSNNLSPFVFQSPIQRNPVMLSPMIKRSASREPVTKRKPDVDSPFTLVVSGLQSPTPSISTYFASPISKRTKSNYKLPDQHLNSPLRSKSVESPSHDKVLWNAQIIMQHSKNVIQSLLEGDSVTVHTEKNIPQYEKLRRFQLKTKIENQMNVVNIANRTFMITQRIGEGGYANVFLARDYDEDISLVMKVQMPPCIWEYYILDKIHSAKVESEEDYFQIFVVKAQGLHLYEGSSCLLLDYFEYGSLLDMINCYRMKNNVTMNENLAAYYTVGFLYLILEMHRKGIVHCDIKPENVLVYFDEHSDLPRTMNEHLDPFVFKSWFQRHRPVFIDFGRSIDRNLYSENTLFHMKYEGAIESGSLEEYVMQKQTFSKNWTYEIDYLGLANCIHHLVANSPLLLEVEFKERFAIKSLQHKRSWKMPWMNLLEFLINYNPLVEENKFQLLEEKMVEWSGYVNENCLTRSGWKNTLKTHEGLLMDALMKSK